MNKDVIISNLERFGRACLIPISILPVAGILLGIGNALTTDAIREMFPFLTNDMLVFVFELLKTIGKSAFDNLPLFFAVGIAIGMSKKTKATAGLSALVGFMTYIWVLSFTMGYFDMLVTPEQIALDSNAMSSAGQVTTLGKQVIDLNVFGGIIIGLLAYFANKKYADIRLNKVLSFFEGEKFVPFVMMIWAAAFAIIAAFVWPQVASVITSFSGGLDKLGAFGVFLYGAGERLLIPFGLHHVLNTMISYTELGGAVDVCGQTYYGNMNMFAAALDCGAKITPEMSKYFSGTMIVKMFGLPGAALAMYKTASPENRDKVGALMISAAATSFLVGITEPLEFTFLFVAPILYVVHALLAGFAFVLAYITNTALISMQGTGFINFILFDILNTENVPWLNVLWLGPLFFSLYYFTFKTFILKLDLKTPGRGKGEQVELKTKSDAKAKYNLKSTVVTTNEENESENDFAKELVAAHGGIDNIEEVSNCISRLRINVYDTSLVNTDIIKETLGANGVVIVAKQVQSVYGPVAKEHARAIKDEYQLEN